MRHPAVRFLCVFASLRLCGCILSLVFIGAAAPEIKPSGFQGLGPLLGQAPSIPAPPYKLKWTYKADDAERVAIVGSPSIVDGVVYIADSKGILHAIDLQTGKFKWKYPTENGFETTPLVAGNRIFLGDLAGIFHCVSTDGKKIWTFNLPTDPAVKTPGLIYGSPTVHDGKVYLATSSLDEVESRPVVVCIGEAN